MLGAIVGDIAGSCYESCGLKSYEPEEINLFMAASRFTDDTVMTLAVARWLTESKDKGAADLTRAMQELGRKYPRAGYGPAFARWLASGEPRPYGSWGNGAAMRVSPVGLYAGSMDEALRLAEVSAAVSHDHPRPLLQPGPWPRRFTWRATARATMPYGRSWRTRPATTSAAR